MEQIDVQTFLQSKVTLKYVRTGKSLGNIGKCESSKNDRDEYDPIYDTAFEFARTHGYSFVVFEDDQPKKTRKKNMRKSRKSQKFTGRTTYNTFLPHPPIKRDRRFPVHVVKYAPNLGDRSRRKCRDETRHILDSVVNDMKIIESVKTDISMVKTVSDCLHKLDVVLPSCTGGAAEKQQLKKPKLKKRRSGSRTSLYPNATSANKRKSASPSSKASVSQQNLDNRRASPQEGAMRVSSTTEAIVSSATLDEFKNYLSTVCVKIFQEQPHLSPNASIPKAETSSVRKCADGDTATLDEDTYSKEKPHLLKSYSCTGRLANVKLKATKSHSKSKEFLKKYYARQGRKQEENQSLNNAPNDETDTTNDFDEDNTKLSKTYSPLSPKCSDNANNVHRLCNSISATVFQETQLSHSSKVKETQASTLPLSKIDFVRVQNKAVKIKSSTTHQNQDMCCRGLRGHLHSIPRTLKLAGKILHSPPITRIRCNPHPRLAKFRANNSCPSQVHAFESCHSLCLQQLRSSNRTSSMLAFSRLESGAGSMKFAAAYGGVCQPEPNIAAERKPGGVKNGRNASSSMNTETHMLTLHEFIPSEMLDQAVSPMIKEPPSSLPSTHITFPGTGLFGNSENIEVSSMNVSPLESYGGTEMNVNRGDMQAN